MALPADFPSSGVVIRAWGATRRDADDAARDAEQAPGAQRWRVARVIVTDGPPCPIPIRDPNAIVQAAEYDEAWAIYPTTDTADHNGGTRA